MNARHPASFRDPAGFVFTREGTVYRQVNARYRPTYDAVTASGLFDQLIDRGLLIPHREADVEPCDRSTASVVLRPDPVPFISYPYEWCPGELREAALVILEAQLLALEHGFTLKDASAFNVQFVDARPVLIDTLSFEPYEEGRPWVAYGQFCRHFLAPLALARAVDPRMLALSQNHLDGVPLELAARLLPRSSRYTWGLGVHVHAHASAQRRHADAQTRDSGRPMSKKAVTGLIESLRSSVRKQVWEPSKSAWSDYYAARESYSEVSIENKREVVSLALRAASETGAVRSVWDLGANTGQFSELAATVTGALVVALESDVSAVELHWRNRNESVLPLVCDLTNPAPALGWAHQERAALLQRGPADLVMALALIHHLAIGNNVPLEAVAGLLAGATREFAILEWVPKTDPMVERMLSSREDVFDAYDEETLRRGLAAHFSVVREFEIGDSSRKVFLLRLRTEP